MPTVKSKGKTKKFPYTKEGKKAAKAEKDKGEDEVAGRIAKRTGKSKKEAFLLMIRARAKAAKKKKKGKKK